MASVALQQHAGHIRSTEHRTRLGAGEHCDPHLRAPSRLCTDGYCFGVGFDDGLRSFAPGTPYDEPGWKLAHVIGFASGHELNDIQQQECLTCAV